MKIILIRKLLSHQFNEKVEFRLQHMPLKIYQSWEIAFVTFLSESILDTTVLENYDFTYFHATK